MGTLLITISVISVFYLLIYKLRYQIILLDPYILDIEKKKKKMDIHYILTIECAKTINMAMAIIVIFNIIPEYLNIQLHGIYNYLFIIYGLLTLYVYLLFDILTMNMIYFDYSGSNTGLIGRIIFISVCKLITILSPTLMQYPILSVDYQYIGSCTMLAVTTIQAGLLFSLTTNYFSVKHLPIMLSNLINANIRKRRQIYMDKFGKE